MIAVHDTLGRKVTLVVEYQFWRDWIQTECLSKYDGFLLRKKNFECALGSNEQLSLRLRSSIRSDASNLVAFMVSLHVQSCSPNPIGCGGLRIRLPKTFCQSQNILGDVPLKVLEAYEVPLSPSVHYPATVWRDFCCQGWPFRAIIFTVMPKASRKCLSFWRIIPTYPESSSHTCHSWSAALSFGAKL